MQWREGGIAPQVVFEVLSHKSTRRGLDRRRAWYFYFGVEEYYEIDPGRGRAAGWFRNGLAIREIADISDWVSPRLGIRFGVTEDLRIFGPNGRPFVVYADLIWQIADAKAHTERARQEFQDAERERLKWQQIRLQAERERRQIEEESQTLALRRQRLEAKLRALGIDPND
jgi:hypothetical protein